MWQIIRENPRAVVYAVLMHLLLLALLMVGLDWTPDITKPGAPKAIQAELVSPDRLENIKKKKLEEQRKLDAERKRKADAEKKRLAEIERKKKTEQEAKKKAEADRKRKLELDRKRKADTEKKRQAEIERKKKAQQEASRKAEAERKLKAEAEKRRIAEAERKKKAEQALQTQLDAEQEARAQGVVAEYVGYIKEKVERNWLRPPGSPQGLSCVVQVRLIPGGDVADVRIVQSSGDPVFDRSVETAVFKAAPLPLPPDAALFNRFRQINFVFKPN